MSAATRKQYFYVEIENPTTSYKDTNQSHAIQFSSRYMKMIVEGAGGVIEYSLIGANNSEIDGVIKTTDGVVDFTGLETQKIAVRRKAGTVSSVRVWAWK